MEELKMMTRDALRALVVSRGLELPKRHVKADLVRLLQAKSASSAPQPRVSDIDVDVQQRPRRARPSAQAPIVSDAPDVRRSPKRRPPAQVADRESRPLLPAASRKIGGELDFLAHFPDDLRALAREYLSVEDDRLLLRYGANASYEADSVKREAECALGGGGGGGGGGLKECMRLLKLEHRVDFLHEGVAAEADGEAAHSPEGKMRASPRSGLEKPGAPRDLPAAPSRALISESRAYTRCVPTCLRVAADWLDTLFPASAFEQRTVLNLSRAVERAAAPGALGAREYKTLDLVELELQRNEVGLFRILPLFTTFTREKKREEAAYLEGHLGLSANQDYTGYYTRSDMSAGEAARVVVSLSAAFGGVSEYNMGMATDALDARVASARGPRQAEAVAEAQKERRRRARMYAQNIVNIEKLVASHTVYVNSAPPDAIFRETLLRGLTYSRVLRLF